MNLPHRALATSIALLIASSAQSQDRWALGLAVESAPSFPSSSEQSLAPAPLIDRLKDGESLYADLNMGPRIELFASDAVELGIALNFDAGRDEDDLPMNLAGLGEVERSIEIGGYASWRIADLTVRLDVLGDVADGHGGLLASPSIEWSSDPTERLRFNSRIGADWASTGYVSSYFGIDSSQSSSTGLPVYSPDAGLARGFIRVGFAYDLDERWVIVGSAAVSRWMGDAEDSPVARMGDDDDVRARLGLMYVW